MKTKQIQCWLLLGVLEKSLSNKLPLLFPIKLIAETANMDLRETPVA